MTLPAATCLAWRKPATPRFSLCNSHNLTGPSPPCDDAAGDLALRTVNPGKSNSAGVIVWPVIRGLLGNRRGLPVSRPVDSPVADGSLGPHDHFAVALDPPGPGGIVGALRVADPANGQRLHRQDASHARGRVGDDFVVDRHREVGGGLPAAIEM